MTQNKTLLCNESLEELASVSQPPCLSLYQPTHRSRPENQQDPIRFRNLLKAIEASLRQTHPAAETRLLLRPFEELAHDHDFWNHTLDGLAVPGGPSVFRVFRLQRPVAELAVVADTFHAKPLRRFLQSADRYQILGLSLEKIRIFEGNRDAVDEIELAARVPRTITEALGDQLTEPQLTTASYGGAGQASMTMRYGQGGKKDEENIDAERFFRAVDRALLDHHSRPSGLQLMLTALPEHHNLFHRVSHNPFLMATGLTVNADTMQANWSGRWAGGSLLFRPRRCRGGRDWQQPPDSELNQNDNRRTPCRFKSIPTVTSKVTSGCLLRSPAR